MELSYKELAHELPMMLKAGVVPYIRGSPALGKSSLARMIAEKFNLSVQSASTTLKSLLNKGYLKRDELTAASGGKEFKWSCYFNF